LIISVHIPKTAGTSLITEIKRGALGRYRLDDEDRPTLLDLGWRMRRLAARAAARWHARRLLQDYDVIHGHFLANKYAFLYPRAGFITFLRDPVPRLLSHYYYFRDVASRNPVTVAKNPVIRMVADGELGLVEFARSEAMRHMYERFLDGLDPERFTLVGITERYAESIALLNGLLGTALEARHERRTDRARHAAEYEPVLPELVEANRGNQRIYAAAQTLFERRLRGA
jgi:hypothetical protein